MQASPPHKTVGATRSGRITQMGEAFHAPGVDNSTKIADRLLTQYLVKENTDPGSLIGSISPGLLLSDNWFAEQKAMPAEEQRKFQPIMNILCD